MGNCIIVASGKGGTGKSSLTAGIASCMAAEGHKTLCIDTDVGLRSLDIILGMSDCVLMDFYDVILGRTSVLEAAAGHPVIENLYMLTAPTCISPDEIPEEGVKRLLSEAASHFDYCFIDLPAGLGSIFRLFAYYSDQAIVVATAESASLRAAQRTSQELDRFGVKHTELVVNRVRPSLLKDAETTIDDAMDIVGIPLIGIVPEDRYVILGGDIGEPLILWRKTGAARAYLNISRRIAGKTTPLIKIRKG